MATIASQQGAQGGSQPAWNGFRTGIWRKEINVRDFIQQNYEPYEGDESFLAGATERTLRIWKHLTRLFVEERRKGVLDVSQMPSSITAHGPGYIDRDDELIVGLQIGRSAEARDHAEWRPANGRERFEGLWL